MSFNRAMYSTLDSMFKVSGSTVVRNASILGYPFKESVRSVLPLCDEFIINCGDSEDSTLELCEELAKESSKIRIIRNSWQQTSQAAGFQIKRQTDLALAECKHEWCLVIQADEVLHEADYPAIRLAMEIAQHNPDIDGILFDYLHFYGSHHYTIKGRNWYRREVRAFKNHRNISAHRDAQGYRRNGNRLKVISANARVFHYGYVRSPESLRAKFREMNKWWGTNHCESKQDFSLHRHVGLSRYQHSHPAVMLERIAAYGDLFDPKTATRKWDRREIKNLLTLIWEKVTHIRLGEFKNYEIANTKINHRFV